MTEPQQSHMFEDDTEYDPEAGSGSRAAIPMYKLRHIITNAADQSMVKSIRKRGLLQPIILNMDEKTGMYSLSAGSRRLAAVRALDGKLIEAVVKINRNPEFDTITENITRTRNIVREYEAICALQKKGYDDDDVIKVTGMSKAAFTSVCQLSKLIPALYELLALGKMAPTTAMQAAKLPKAIQEKIAREHPAVVSFKDVRDERQAVAAAESKAMPESMFKSDWRSDAQARIAGILAAIEGVPSRMAESLAAVLEQAQNVLNEMPERTDEDEGDDGDED